MNRSCLLAPALILASALVAPLSFAEDAPGGAANDAAQLKDLGLKLPAVTEVLGNALQVAQLCGMTATDMQGTQHAYFTILSTSATVNSFRTISPEIKKLWPTEAEFRASYQRGQDAAKKPTAEVCAQVRQTFPRIDEHEEQRSRVLAARLKLMQEADTREADARIAAGHSPIDSP